jgi:fibronectin type 3 domain-containing protein
MLGTSLPNGEAVVNLSGTGALLQVSLTWQPPGSSADPVAGYNIYRSADGGASYQLLNPSVLTLTNYFDANVLSGRTYNYVVESVDAAGNQSAPSNSATVSIP